MSSGERVGVILAATRGLGLENVTAVLPRPLFPVGPDVLLGHQVSIMEELGIRRVVVVANYKMREIEEFLSSRDWKTQIVVRKQEDLSGTAIALETVIREEHSPFLVFSGDVVFSKRDVEALLREHERNESTATLGAVGTDKPEKYGILKIVQDRIVGIVEKPDRPLTHLANAGVYAFEPEVEKYVSLVTRRGRNRLTDFIDLMIGENQRVFYSLFNDYWYELSDIDSWISASKQKTLEAIEKSARDSGLLVDPGATVSPGVVLEPPVMVGDGATIGRAARITGPSLVSRDTRVGDNSTVYSSMVHEGAKIEENVVLDDAIVMPGARIKRGTIARRSVLF